MFSHFVEKVCFLCSKGNHLGNIALKDVVMQEKKYFEEKTILSFIFYSNQGKSCYMLMFESASSRVKNVIFDVIVLCLQLRMLLMLVSDFVSAQNVHNQNCRVLAC